MIIMLGARIAALRRERNWSQAQLAARLKISPSTLGMYEQERRQPTPDMLVRLAREFRVSTDYLLTGKASPWESEALTDMLTGRILSADQRLDGRPDRPFSREELVVLFAAMLMEP